MTDKAFLGFWIDESEADQLRQLAVEADRSLSAELRRAVKNHLVRSPGKMGTENDSS